MQLQVKHQKTAEITYLKGTKRTNKVLPNIFRGFQVKKKGIIDILKTIGQHEK